PAAGHQRSAVAANDPHRNDRSLSVDPQSHVSRHGAYLCRPCDRLRRADRLRLAPVGADRDPDAGDRPRGALSRSEVRRRLPPLQGRGSPLALTIPPLPPAGPSDKPAASLPRASRCWFESTDPSPVAAGYRILKVAGRCDGKDRRPDSTIRERLPEHPLSI